MSCESIKIFGVPSLSFPIHHRFYLKKPHSKTVFSIFDSTSPTLYSMSHYSEHQESTSKDSIPEESNPQFDDSRIKNHPDKLLLSRIKTYFKAFTTGDFNGIKQLEATEYTMTDIRKSSYPCYPFFSVISF